MRKLLILLFTLTLPLVLNAQTIDVGPPDTSMCSGASITLTAITTGVNGTPTFTSVTLPSDDVHSQVLEIGFPFDFFGNTYTQCVASSNGYVTFDVGTAGGGSPWNIGNASPTPGVPDNSIMFPWQDTNPGAGSGGTNAADCGDGTFIVDYVDIAMFSCTTLEFTMQVKLYQGTNIIDTYITEKPLCATWNGGAAIHGLENAAGTQSVIVPGRNFPTQWATTNDAVRFTPDGFGSYTIDQTIPFNPTPVGTESLIWTDEAGNILSYLNTITVTPTAPTWYYCTYQSACSAVEVMDSILVEISTIQSTSTTTDVSCNGFTDGSIEIDATGTTNLPVDYELIQSGNVIDTISGLGVDTISGLGVDTISGLGAGVYDIIVTNQIGCVTILTGNTISEPGVLFANGDHADISCYGEDDGEAYVYPYGGTTPYTYQWSDPTGSDLYSIAPLTSGNLQVTITDDNGCVLDTNMNIIEPLPLLFDVTSWEDTCYRHNGEILIEMSGGTEPYDYIWFSNIDPNNSTVDDINKFNLVTGLSFDTYDIRVYDDNGCSVDITSEVTLIEPPVADFLTRSNPTEIIDPSVRFINESFNGFTYEWFFGDNTNSYEENPWHTYDGEDTYLVELVAYSDPTYGCSDTAFGYITVNPLYTFYVPNSFTPDGDGLNDWWGSRGKFYEEESFNLKVYDRWGKIMFNTDNPNQFWNGRYLNTGYPVKQGLYVYIFELKKFNTFEPKVIKGTVTIYRNH